MLALVQDGEPRLDPDHREPEASADEALVRVRVAGICDTDLQLLAGYMGFRGVPGHEFVGVVDDDGSAFAGRRVVADINAGCGRCDDCQVGGGHHCHTRTVLGIVGRQGAFAERIAIPRRCLVEVPDHVPDDAAVFAEPLAAGLHVLDEVPFDPKGPVVVLGDGKLGLLTTFALRGAGVATHVVGHHREQLALAQAVGADISLADTDPLPDDAPVVVDCTGSPTGISTALRCVRPRGTIVLKTTVAGPIDVDLAPLVVNEVRLVGSRCGDMSRAVELLASGSIDPTPLIAARYPLSQAPQALRAAGERGTLKVLVDVS